VQSEGNDYVLTNVSGCLTAIRIIQMNSNIQFSRELHSASFDKKIKLSE
jgi:hypothetical protein